MVDAAPVLSTSPAPMMATPPPCELRMVPAFMTVPPSSSTPPCVP